MCILMKKLFPASSPSFPERTENAVFFFQNQNYKFREDWNFEDLLVVQG